MIDNSRIHDKEFCIIGGGLAGPLISIFLAQRGIRSNIYDKRPDIRETRFDGGRSIDMSLSDRGWHALDKAGLLDKLKRISVPKCARMVHLEDGTNNLQQYGREDQVLYSINRKALNSILLDRTEETGLVNIYFNHKCENVNLDSGEIIFINSETDEEIHKQYDKIIGTDGIFSKVRNSIAKAAEVENGLIKHDFVYKELIMPPDKNGKWIIPESYIHIWPRYKCFLVGMPNYDGTFTCTIFYPENGLPYVNFFNEKDILHFFKNNFPELVTHIPDLTQQFLEKKTSQLFSVTNSKWHYKDKAVLIGDSSHAIVPFYGMGMNVAFEDCTIFDNLMDEYKFDWGKIFSEFFRIRKPLTDSIANLSLKNLSNLEHSVDKDFQFRWELERKVWEMYPDKWMPTYAMVVFSHIPFTDVEKINENQCRILNYLLQQDEIRNKFGCREFPDVLKKHIEHYGLNHNQK